MQCFSIDRMRDICLFCVCDTGVCAKCCCSHESRSFLSQGCNGGEWGNKQADCVWISVLVRWGLCFFSVCACVSQRSASAADKSRSFESAVWITFSFPVPLSISSSPLPILFLTSLFSVQEKNKDKDKRFRPLYDIPYMFEAREFLRKKLIGKKVRPQWHTWKPLSHSLTLCHFPEYALLLLI